MVECHDSLANLLMPLPFIHSTSIVPCSVAQVFVPINDHLKYLYRSIVLPHFFFFIQMKNSNRMNDKKKKKWKPAKTYHKNSGLHIRLVRR